MIQWLYNYDVYPRVVRCGKESAITVKPLGQHVAFDAHAAYHFEILPLLHRTMVQVSDDNVRVRVPAELRNGSMTVRWLFDKEQEYYLFLYCGERLVERFSVYALQDDLADRLPLLGDLHLHSTWSDGQQSPEIVVAEWRRRGLDFTVLSDHHNYAGSLAAMAAYRDAAIDLCIIPGEEVHLPGNDVHIVNFGGEYSVNFQVENNLRYVRACGIDPETAPARTWCTYTGRQMPATISEREYREQVERIADEVTVPEGIDRFAFLACIWVCRKIREAGGLSIFAHPYWIKEAYHVPESMTDALFAGCPFDCFEVLGGEKYLNQNEFQTWHYVRQLLSGHRLPVVGSSDSHNVYAGRDTAYAATIVFAKENERTALIDAVKEGYTVAVDLISEEKRLVGDLRLMRYARFLLDYYYPIQEELCAEEGRLMKAYACGTDPDAAAKLKQLSGQTRRLREHLIER